MQLIEKYSLDCGINPNSLEREEVYSNFVTLGLDKFVLLSSLKNDGAPGYSMMQEVFDILNPILKEREIDLIYLPNEENENIIGCQKMSSQITIDKAAYLAKRALLFVGNSSYLPHLFAMHETPFISISSKAEKNKTNVYKKWIGKSEELFYAEDPSEIKPEEIAKKALNILEINEEIEFKTHYVGKKYSKYSIEIVPDLITSPEFAKGEVVAFRLDFLSNPREEHVRNAVASAMKRKCALVISEPIESIFNYKKEILASGIHGILFNLKKDVFEKYKKEKLADFVERLSRLGKKFLLAAPKSEFTEEERRDLKFYFLDICTINFSEETEMPDIFKVSENEGAIFKSTRFIFSNRKKYLSKQAYIEDKSVDPIKNYQPLSEISDLTSLQKELESALVVTTKIN